MIILGINAYHADASAAIFVDGKLIAATEEERFTRVKHWAGFPSMAVLFCLKEAGINIEQVDYFAIGRDPKAKFFKKILYVLANPGGSAATIKDRFSNSRKVAGIDEELSALSGMAAHLFKNKIVNVEHHRSHLASAFFASPFEKAACLSIDGSGDFTTTMTAVGKTNSIEVLQSLDFPHSLGIFYTAFTQLLGFPHYGDEYKVMGMAPYGEPLFVDKLHDVVTLSTDGLFKLNLQYFRKGTQGIITYNENHVPMVAPLFSELMIEKFGNPRKNKEELNAYHKNLAASVQRFTEEVIFHVLNHLHMQTGLTDVCIAGGVAQNSVANGKITRNTPFKNVYIPSAGHDAGISMGAALFVQHQQKNMQRSPIFSAYTGSKWTNEEIIALLKKENISY